MDDNTAIVWCFGIAMFALIVCVAIIAWSKTFENSDRD